ncbi:MAG TPA: septation protein SepH [Umezawaea sp.]|nr:septation protein SepH [Umezawaea sp.]
MRALRVIGLDEDGKSVICEDPSGGERFLLPADERLRAAARGDLTRLGQIQIEVESQMRPREIQARIRAGESVEQVAAASGLPSHRVERYAYPVLLERSRTADLAQRAHPVREDGPDVQTLGEVVAHSFGLRGQDYTDVGWDSWRGEDGKWVVQMHWTAGRSDNIAHWAFHPGAHGGTVTALDEAAVDLMDPNPNRTLRTVRPVTQLARQALEAQTPVREETETEILAKEEPAPAPVVPEQPVAEPEPVVEAPAAEAPPVAPPVRKEPPKRGKKTHPIVPSWEDVLLGVRSHRG